MKAPLKRGIWIGGIVVYHACAAWAPRWGSALPTLAITFVFAWITRPAPAGGRSALAQSRG